MKVILKYCSLGSIKYRNCKSTVTAQTGFESQGNENWGQPPEVTFRLGVSWVYEREWVNKSDREPMFSLNFSHCFPTRWVIPKWDQNKTKYMNITSSLCFAIITHWKIKGITFSHILNEQICWAAWQSRNIKETRIKGTIIRSITDQRLTVWQALF